jgi:S1-C subfamily serine protease
MHKTIIVLVIISIALASLLAIQIIRDGNVAMTLLNPKPTTQVQNIPPLPVTNTAMNFFNTSGIKINDNASAILNAQSTVFNQIFNNAKNSVVQITSTVNSPIPNIIINGNPLQRQSTSLGSGFILDPSNGLIITNNHVIQGANKVDVTFIDGNTYSAKVIGADPLSDLAVLQITDDFSSQHLTPLSLANSSQLQVGQQVIAIGNPFALSDTMTNGIISQVGRVLPNQEMGFSIPDVIQTNAAINPGNSGGPLLDMQGNVIGVNSAITSQTGEFAGIGFAIPSNTVAKIIPHLVNGGNYDHPWLGISGVDLTPDLAQQLGMPRDSKGVIIASVTPGSPAAKAGIVGSVQNGGNTTPSGDIVTSIDGHQVKRIEDIISYIEEQKSTGDKVVVTLNRDGQPHDLTLTLQARPLPTLQVGD